MNRKLGPLTAIALVALIGAGCGSNGPSETGVTSNTGAASNAGAAGNTGTASSSIGAARSSGAASKTGTAITKRATHQGKVASPSPAGLSRSAGSPSPAGLPGSAGSPPPPAGRLPTQDPRMQQ